MTTHCYYVVSLDFDRDGNDACGILCLSNITTSALLRQRLGKTIIFRGTLLKTFDEGLKAPPPAVALVVFECSITRGVDLPVTGVVSVRLKQWRRCHLASRSARVKSLLSLTIRPFDEVTTVSSVSSSSFSSSRNSSSSEGSSR